MIKIAAVFFVSLTLLIRQCSVTEPLPAKDFISWVESEDNGLLVKKEIGDYRFLLQYKPHEYLVMQNEDKLEFSDSEMRTLKNEIKDMQYYTFRMEAIGTNNDVLKHNIIENDEYYARLEYFAMKMQNDVCLVEKGDTLDCLLFHYERAYGIDPRSTFVLGFPVSSAHSDKTFVYNDKTLGCGPVKMTIRQQDIER